MTSVSRHTEEHFDYSAPLPALPKVIIDTRKYPVTVLHEDRQCDVQKAVLSLPRNGSAFLESRPGAPSPGHRFVIYPGRSFPYGVQVSCPRSLSLTF